MQQKVSCHLQGFLTNDDFNHNSKCSCSSSSNASLPSLSFSPFATSPCVDSCFGITDLSFKHAFHHACITQAISRLYRNQDIYNHCSRDQSNWLLFTDATCRWRHKFKRCVLRMQVGVSTWSFLAAWSLSCCKARLAFAATLVFSSSCIQLSESATKNGVAGFSQAWGCIKNVCTSMFNQFCMVNT